MNSKFDRLLDDLFIGFNRQALEHVPTYPPYNIIRETDEAVSIEVATSGFSKKELSVEVDNNTLIIKGQKNQAGDDKQYIRRGLASRDFTLKFTLAQFYEVKEADVNDGLLTVTIRKEVPEEKKPRVIPFLSSSDNKEVSLD